MFAAIAYLVLAVILCVTAWMIKLPYIAVFFYWSALSLFLVSLAYIANAGRIFRKRQNGTIPWYIRWAFIPFLLGAQLYNAWQRRNDKVPPIQEVEPGLFLACRLFPPDVDSLKHENVTAILDATCEFDGLDWTVMGEQISYLNIPVLDHAAPNRAQLRQAINWIHHHRKRKRNVVVHCALGRGRSVLVMAAYLLAKEPDADVDEVLERIQETRETANLNRFQRKALKKMHKRGELVVRNRVCLIANPVSGRKLWADKKHDIMTSLNSYFDMSIKTTSPTQNGTDLAREAMDEHPDMIIACGGDGTVAEVASVTVNTDVALGVIPLGTANALAHVLMGIESKAFGVQKALDVLISGDVKAMDTATCNDELVLLLVGIGFEHKMIESADREAKNSSGQFAYLHGFWQALSEHKAKDYTLTLDEMEPQDVHTNSMIIANAAPVFTLLAQGQGQPEHDDGLLDVNWLEPTKNSNVNVLSIAELAFNSVTQTQLDKHAHHTHARRVTVSCAEGIDYVIDGEMRQADALEIKVQPASLKVMVPSKP
ncbi:diacylglycerol kinase family protein [Pseudoalteromonas sp. BDTF-M6]|uniref:diacylglycerol kinase family protein n=1 Tax=Pseudoalteromonas sp. BDTF-M6 TaxID=2796132 RepID=UPI001BB075D4|nr:diacylglycerol kinase family protein [Pseudoalteromonas sp. BDTF-M6]MBS3797767.1 dual specificity protein phosphatase family protein [Pseudoalteromonas sp. BDTF-M6]